MDIDIPNAPVAGQPFVFYVSGGIGTARISVYVNSEQIHHHECDDPPCHEMLVIPHNAAGVDLEVRATDSTGNTVQAWRMVLHSDGRTRQSTTLEN